MRVWRNWQTRMIQVHIGAIRWRFKSSYPHHNRVAVLVKTATLFLSSTLNISQIVKGYCIVANVITGIRIVCALGLIFCPTFSAWFYVLYIVGGISDVLDGIVARHLGKETKFGARLDMVADIIFTLTVLIKVVRTVFIPMWLIIWIFCIAVIKCINMISGFVMHKRLVSEHTIMNKICGVLLFAIPLCIGRFPRQPVAVLIVLTCGVATFAAIQEGHYIRTGKEIN